LAAIGRNSSTRNGFKKFPENVPERTWEKIPDAGVSRVPCAYGSVGHGEERLCSFHQTILPKAKSDHNNRICSNFDPTADYRADNPFPQFLLFSPTPFPGHTIKLEWRREEYGGN